MRISASLRFISSLFALTLMTTLVACGGGGEVATEETTAPETTETPAAETTETPAAEETETPAEEKPENVGKLQDTLLKSLGEQLPGTELTAVSCPADVTMKADEAFDCDVTTPDGEFSIAVVMTDDTGNLTFKSKGIVSLVKLEKTLQQSIMEQAKADVTADCGSKEKTLYFFEKIGETFECDVTNKADGKSQPATITIDTENGDVSFKM